MSDDKILPGLTDEQRSSLERTGGHLGLYALTREQHAALLRHGYDPDALPSGVGGPPSVWQGAYGIPLRSRVCKLDGILIDGHEVSDLDYGGGCIHCGADPIPEDEW